MENNDKNIGTIIRNFFEDIADVKENKTDIKIKPDIEKNLSTEEFYKLKEFFEQIEHIKKEKDYYRILQEEQSEKIENFLNKLNNEDTNKPPTDLSGIYFVISLNDINEEQIEDKFFNEIEEKNKFKLFAEDQLKEKLDTVMHNNNHKNILYIGKADGEDNKLYNRIVKQYMTEKYNHSGGRAIWQIKVVDNFYITWIPTNDAELVESALIQAYSCLLKKNKKENGEKINKSKIFYYPFANRRK